MSEQFADSLQSMQARYTQVQDELAQVSAQRLQELTEKGNASLQRLQQILDVLPGARGDCGWSGLGSRSQSAQRQRC